MKTVSETIQEFQNTIEEFTFKDGRKFVYNFNKLCNAQVSLATECLNWCVQCGERIPNNDFNVLINSEFVFWREQIVSFLLLEEKDKVLQPFNKDNCYYVKDELLNLTTAPEPTDQLARDQYVKIQKIIESFFLARGNYATLLRFTSRTEKQKKTQQEELLDYATAMEKISNALKDFNISPISKNEYLKKEN